MIERTRWDCAYTLWKAHVREEEDLVTELAAMEWNPKEKKDAFYQDLSFGTGGLRGVIGVGTNRLNVYTVAKASQGVAAYIKKNFPKEKWGIAVSHDSRIKSDLFAKVAAGVFADNGLSVHLYPRLMPTPCLSYAVRYFGCAGGVMVTASHNPSQYNGYKVYGPDGCQITTEAASEIQKEICAVRLFEGYEYDPQRHSFEEGLARESITYIGEEVLTSYLAEVKAQSLSEGREETGREISIIYTPLNGAGREPVLRVLKESGYTDVTVVAEQENPDGHFPTCPYPNPEIPDAMELGMEYARERQAELLVGTDPDCDRVGVAVRKPDGAYVLLSGNEVGLLLFDYICARRTQNGTMPAHPVAVKTIVTSDMAEQIAAHYGVTVRNVLTGFKYIGEQIGRMETEGRVDDFVFGFEESCGYLAGTYVRDKDGVVAAFLVCEMFCYWRTQGISLYDKLEELYETYGYCLNTQHSYTFEGAEGFDAMQERMVAIRKTFSKEGAQLGGKAVLDVKDYLGGIDGLPASDVVKLKLEDNCSAVVRPSGTEPKLKAYISVSAPGRPAAAETERAVTADLEMFLA